MAERSNEKGLKPGKVPKASPRRENQSNQSATKRTPNKK